MSRWVASLLLASSACCVCSAQQPASTKSSSTNADATALIALLNQAVTSGVPISKVVLTGTATFQAGSTSDTGQATLTADTTGQYTLQLALSKLGSKAEHMSSAPGGTCDWSGADGVSKVTSGLACLRPVAWFFPAVSLQPASLLQQVGLSDLGTGSVAGGTYRHLQSQLVESFTDPAMIKQLMQESTVDVGLDPTTTLPVVLSYTTRPDSGAAVFIPVVIRFSNYQRMSGIQVPSRIDRYVNGSLQLSIAVTGATVS